MLDFAQARRTMVDCQIRTSDVTDRAVLAAIDAVPRELFMPSGRADFAYSDQHVPLMEGAGGELRYMLNPVLLARLIQALEIESGSKVLDVGGGFGYAADLLATLGASVTALENSQPLLEEARQRLAQAGAPGTIELRCGSLDGGARENGPFQAILVHGAVERRPDTLLGQLASRGRLVCLKRNGAAGHAQVFVRSGNAIGERRLFDAAAPVLAEFRRAPEFQF